jgi:hypothetical protein
VNGVRLAFASRRVAPLVGVLAVLSASAPVLAGPYKPPKVAVDLQDQAAAQRALLRMANLPASTVAGAAGRASKAAGCKGVDVDSSALTITGRGSSPYFVRSQGFLFSQSEVLASASQARAYFGRELNRSALRCVGEMFLEGLRVGLELSGAKATARIVESRGPALRSAADQTAGLRLTARLTAAGQSVTGPAAQLERKLIATVADRMAARPA